MSRRRRRSKLLCIEQLETRQMLSAGVATGWGLPVVQVSDDCGDAFEAAAQVTLSSTGSARLTGQIEQAFDVDMFQIVAPVTGQLMIQQLALRGNRLDPSLRVYDSQQQLIAENDDSGWSRKSAAVISVTAGQTYYVQAAGYGWTRGAYMLQFMAIATPTDDHGNTIAQATRIELSSSESVTALPGQIEQPGDADVFSFVATATGQVTITQSASDGSRLDSYLYVYDADGTLLAKNDDAGSSLDSELTISVVAGSVYYIKAAAYHRSVGAYTLALVTVESEPIDSSPTTAPDSGTVPDSAGTATDPATDTTTAVSGFQIDVTMTGFTAAQQAIVQQAIAIWEQIIVGDLPDVTWGAQVIDDIAITISSTWLDGSGNVLGQSAATEFRNDSYLPYLGFIQLDTADVAAMERSGSLLSVLTHEIAHVLGFGVIWDELGLLTNAGTSSPGFLGANAVAEYNALFGTSVTAVPVEADGGSGTALAHWEESVLQNELMTGWYNSGQSNPLSRITVASMADLGYQVDMDAAESYTVSSTSGTAAIASAYSYRRFGRAPHSAAHAVPVRSSCSRVSTARST